MGRLVRAPREVATDNFRDRVEAVLHPTSRGHSHIRFVQADGYLKRIGKYVPAEVLAFSLFINVILDQALKTGGRSAMIAGLPVTTIATAVLIAGTVLTPFTVWCLRRPGDAWALNSFVSTLLYPFWAYALGSVAFAGHWDGNLAAILLASATLVSGLFAPSLPQKRRLEREHKSEEERLRAASASPYLMPVARSEAVAASAKK